MGKLVESIVFCLQHVEKTATGDMASQATAQREKLDAVRKWISAGERNAAAPEPAAAPSGDAQSEAMPEPPAPPAPLPDPPADASKDAPAADAAVSEAASKDVATTELKSLTEA